MPSIFVGTECLTYEITSLYLFFLIRLLVWVSCKLWYYSQRPFLFKSVFTSYPLQIKSIVTSSTFFYFRTLGNYLVENNRTSNYSIFLVSSSWSRVETGRHSHSFSHDKDSDKGVDFFTSTPIVEIMDGVVDYPVQTISLHCIMDFVKYLASYHILTINGWGIQCGVILTVF